MDRRPLLTSFLWLLFSSVFTQKAADVETSQHYLTKLVQSLFALESYSPTEIVPLDVDRDFQGMMEQDQKFMAGEIF